MNKKFVLWIIIACAFVCLCSCCLCLMVGYDQYNSTSRRIVNYDLDSPELQDPRIQTIMIDMATKQAELNATARAR